MVKRYVFFRNDHGHGSDDEKYAPKHLLKLLGESSAKSSDGVAWQNFNMEQFQVALRPRFLLLDPNDVEVKGLDASRIVMAAVLEIVAKSPGQAILPKRLIEAADRHAAEYFRMTERSFALVASINIDKLPLDVINVLDCDVFPLPNGRNEFPFPEPLLGAVKDTPYGRHLFSTNYLWIKVATKARTTNAAVEKAMDAINFLRSLWTLFLSYRGWSVRMGGAPDIRSIAVVHLGPLQTIHHPDGSNAEHGMYWYSPDYIEDQPLQRNLERFEAFRVDAFRRIAALPHKADVEELFVRYVTALDSNNPYVTFLQLWSILEKITQTIGAKYEDTTKRVARLFAQRSLVMDMVQSLRLLRNMYVHSARDDHQADQVAYLAKSFVDPMLRSLIENAPKATSMKEVGDFLSLNVDEEVLKTEVRLRQTALEIIQNLKTSKNSDNYSI